MHLGSGVQKFLLILLLVGGVLVGVTAGVLLAVTRDLPQIRSLETFQPAAATRIFTAENTLLAEIWAQRRHPVPLAAVPPPLVDALIATEDRSFFHHSGIDLRGILRAIIHDIQARQFVEGASTITQQLAKTLFLSPRKTVLRKIKEALLAFQMERRYTKQEILQMYLNQVYFGSGAYGVRAAAQVFFGKSLGDLTLDECALIAGMPKAPSRYSPLVDRKRAVKRRDTVLRQMLAANRITPAAYREAIRAPVVVAHNPSETPPAPYFVEYVKQSLEQQLGADRLYRDGLTVYTTLSGPLQQQAEAAVSAGLSELDRRIRDPKDRDRPPQGALLALDVASGGILAMVGGRDYAASMFNRAVNALRQPGSAFKPLLYALAVERGFAQSDRILDAPVVYKIAGQPRPWRPENFSRNYSGEITLRTALAKSKNIPAVRLIEKLGPTALVEFARRMGIESSLSPNMSLALGTSEVTLMELTAAYAAYAGAGNHIVPYGVLEVVDRNGRTVWRARPHRRSAVSRPTAAVVTDMLAAVVTEGTGKRAARLKHPLAGKTGTTNDYKDAWFVGYSAATACGVWVGFDRQASLGRGETGARAALPIWIEFMQAALSERPYRHFDIPDGVVKVTIDPDTGASAVPGTTGTVGALFLAGTEPRPPS